MIDPAIETEMDVREWLINPFLQRLGYSPAMVTTELSLRYKYLFLGRKKGPMVDRILRGTADYVLDVGKNIRWVIEAKRPGPITDDDREQAYSYAMHPQVRAIVFGVISGTEYEFFHTFNRPERGPILRFTSENIEECFNNTLAILSPGALLREFPDHVPDFGLPLSDNLRSFAKIESGTLVYTDVPPILEQRVKGLRIHIKSGSIVRATGGGISAFVEPSFPNEEIQAWAKAIDAETMTFTTTSEYLSTSISNPTVFTQVREIAVTEGTPIPLILTEKRLHAVGTTKSNVSVEVSGYLQGRTFVAKLVSRSFYPGTIIPFSVCGDLELSLR